MRIVKTDDESFTLYSDKYEECYHNVKDGALRESLSKHVEPALDESLWKKSSLKILDICFGLGYNTLATLYFLRKRGFDKRVKIVSPELDRELVRSLREFKYPKEFEEFREVIESISETGCYKSENFEVEVRFENARETLMEIGDIDIVYQDPFSPRKNPELWTVEYFASLYAATSEEAIVTTYSVASAVRFAMYEAGFRVYEREIEGVKKHTVASKRALPFKELDIKAKMERSDKKALKDEDLAQTI